MSRKLKTYSIFDKDTLEKVFEGTAFECSKFATTSYANISKAASRKSILKEKWYVQISGAKECFEVPKREKIVSKKESKSKIDEGKVMALHKAGWSAQEIAYDMFKPIELVKEVLERKGM